MTFPVSPFENERLSILYETGLLDGEPNPYLEDLCADARAKFGVQMALVTLLEEDVQCVRSGLGDSSLTTPREVTFCNYTILENQLFVVPDARKDSRFSAYPAVTGDPHIRFYAGAPLVYNENIRLGSFCLMDTSPRDVTLAERQALQDYAARATDELVRTISTPA